MANEIHKNAFAEIEFEDYEGYTSRWWYKTPDYLFDEVLEGACVAVRYNDRIKTGVVVATSPVCDINPKNVGFILDAINVVRHDEFLDKLHTQELLLKQMEDKLALNETLERIYAASATDAELGSMLSVYLGDARQMPTPADRAEILK